MSKNHSTINNFTRASFGCGTSESGDVTYASHLATDGNGSFAPGGDDESAAKERGERGMAGRSLPAALPPGASSFVFDRADRSPEQIQRRLDFLVKRTEARKNPANCGKCGKPRDLAGRMCARCLATQRRRVARNKGRAVLSSGESFSLEKIAGMVLQMRREMDKIQSRFRLWQKAVNYRRALKHRTNSIRKNLLKKYVPQCAEAVAMDYLKQTNHKYNHET